MENIGHLVASAQNACRELDHCVDAAESECRLINRKAQDNLKRAQHTEARAQGAASAIGTQLGGMQRRLEQWMAATDRIGNQLQEQRDQANRLVAEIDKERIRGEKIGAQVDRIWDHAQETVLTYNHSMAHWVQTRSRVAGQKAQLDEMLQTMRVQFDGIEDAQNTAFQMMERLMDDDFRLAGQRFSDSRAEAFLAAEDEKLARVRVERLADSQRQQSMLLEIGLKGVEGEQKQKYAQQIQALLKNQQARKAQKTVQRQPTEKAPQKED